LRLTVTRRLAGLLAGDYAGLFPGHGTERGDARPYVPGDDPRLIDWAVTARNHDPHVRDDIADHELDVWVVIDASASLGFGTARATKHELAWSVAGAFAILASTGGNRVGAVRTVARRGGSRPELVPARGGSAHLGALLSTLRREPVDGDVGDMAGALDLVARAARRRGMVVVVSDFLGAPDWERPLRSLARRHEVIAVEILDPREVTLPDVGLVSVQDPETGRRRLVDTRDSKVRRRYDELAARRRSDLATRLRSCGADQMVLRTDRDWVIDFVRFVSGRKARVMARAGAR
jgi:uncharacterized protein (DUF58 family)